jgi:hypothetical protein
MTMPVQLFVDPFVPHKAIRDVVGIDPLEVVFDFIQIHSIRQVVVRIFWPLSLG